MARQDISVTALGVASLSSVVGTLLHRRVDCVEIHSTKQVTADGVRLLIRLTVELPEGDNGSMLVKRLNRLIDVVKVVRLDNDGTP